MNLDGKMASMKKGPLFRFLFPVFSRRLLLRILLIALAAYLIFGYLCIPIILRGKSMEPTYPDGSVNFCWRLRYLFHPPERNDVVIIRLAGERIMLMKRVVALEGEWVEFRNGDLFVNNRKMDEPFAFCRKNWNLSPRRVEAGCVYVVGDNRRTAIDQHNFGQTSLGRVIGGPLW
jgi:signal peptidase I